MALAKAFGANGVKAETPVEFKRAFIEAVKAQVYVNQWHGETPKKLMIMKIDEQYVVAVFGREPLVNEFKLNMESVYKTMIEVVVNEKLELTIN